MPGHLVADHGRRIAQLLSEDKYGLAGIAKAVSVRALDPLVVAGEDRDDRPALRGAGDIPADIERGPGETLSLDGRAGLEHRYLVHGEVGIAQGAGMDVSPSEIAFEV